MGLHSWALQQILRPQFESGECNADAHRFATFCAGGRVLSDWPEAVIVRLRALWAEGHSTAEIGRRLDLSKNAVVGKAHRLNLRPRPSPIRPRADGRPHDHPPRRVRQGMSTLPPLKADAGAPTAKLTELAPLPVYRPKGQPCCWPIGHPRQVGFHFCNSTSLPGKPYCEDHAAIAYVRVRDRREDAA